MIHLLKLHFYFLLSLHLSFVFDLVNILFFFFSYFLPPPPPSFYLEGKHGGVVLISIWSAAWANVLPREGCVSSRVTITSDGQRSLERNESVLNGMKRFALCKDSALLICVAMCLSTELLTGTF